MFTDTHCHIYSEYYDNIDEIIAISCKNNVKRWINNGCNNETNIEVISLIKKYDLMYGALGIHPESVRNYNDSDLNYIENNLNDKKIIAVGEIGLDYHYTKDDRNEQVELFEHQLAIAEKYNKPIIIHSREATQDTITILKKYNVKGVIHSFSGSFETAKEYIKMGFLLGINGVITFKNSKLKEVIQKINLENIVLETDSPYLTPEPFRGKQNNPSHVIDIATFIADLKNVNIDELITITNENIKRVFNI